MPWWAWAAIIIAPFIFAVALHWNVYKNYHYICKNCAKTFKPTTFLRSMFALNGGEQRRMRCPFCDCVDWMEAKKDKA